MHNNISCPADGKDFKENSIKLPSLENNLQANKYISTCQMKVSY